MDNKPVIRSIKDEVALTALDLGIIDSEDYAKLSRHAKQTNESLYNLLVKNDLFDADAYLDKLSEKYGIGVAKSPEKSNLNGSEIPTQFCNKNGIYSMSVEKNNLFVGICVPSSLNALKNLSILSEKKIKASFIDPIYIFEDLGEKQVLVKQMVTSIQEKNGISQKKINPNVIDEDISKEELIVNDINASNNLIDASILTDISELKIDKPKTKQVRLSSDVVKSVDEIFTYAIESGVSDIHFELFKDRASIRIRKNGSLIEVDDYHEFINQNYNAVVARIKILANLDIAERRLPQDGKINFVTAKSKIDVDFRVSVLPTSLGERVVIRILNSSSLAMNVEDLGFAPDQLKDFIKAIDAPQGMVLVTGPTGSGKSTTLYGAINYLNKPNVNILTAEDPVEYTISGISQVQVREDIGLTFAGALRSFLRQDPEIILVGEIRDAETADIATKAALTGHLVLSTLHTNSAIGAISRLVNMGLPSYLISSALSLVVAQRLIRTNCKNCLKDVVIDEELLSDYLKRYTEFKQITFKQGQGCNKCLGSGYDGRIAIHEVLSITNKIQSAINSHQSDGDIFDIAVKQGFKPMTASGIELLKKGIISFEEFVRAVPTTDLSEDSN